MPIKRKFWFIGGPERGKLNVRVLISGKREVVFAYKKSKRETTNNLIPGVYIPTRQVELLVRLGKLKYESPIELIDDLRSRIFKLVPTHGPPIEKKDVGEGYSTYRPVKALQNKTGECFDKAAIIVAIARANGFKARIVGGSNARRGPMKLKAHYWAEVFNGGAWEMIDTVRPNIIFDKKKINWKKVRAQEEFSLS
ncbi:MAG: hypothetical protein QT03_C0001G1061 [archaeon GW2011_AR10]|uniref:Transglutaminase-like domain-containing protein n=1 Tax=Candidatus Iainarchaeum sp. TaxID=3101447 RepID=A0A7J4IRL3_9ARCH|nr:MAG: hypothetical protein QT03_C0001G1061 [archaeon GW2011_AR10]KKR36709.1 MAG: Adhesin-like protein with transglutaminase-like protein [Parcubacteria group bacterium GW2011_GWF2_40_10]HIH08072.1 hypothetical protein [Candidatus Diapherotrites archaeon]